MDPGAFFENVVGASPFGAFTAIGFWVAWKKDREVAQCYQSKANQAKEYADKVTELTVEVVRAIETLEKRRTKR
jgi:hypothetical protein